MWASDSQVTSGSLKRGSFALCQLYNKQPLVDDMAETVNDTGAVEVEACRGFVFEGVKAGAHGEDIPAGFDAVTAERLE